MPDDGETLLVSLVDDIGRIDAAEWDACAGPDNPFVGHAFLSALEDSGSACPRTGWLPQHLVLTDAAGTVLGCAPAYLKSHSYGEYVFDHGWAAAYERAGGRYYPKLQVAVPFTPVPGPRLLVRAGAGTARTVAALAEGMAQIAAQRDVVSVHVTFPREDEWRLLGQAGWLQRTGQQYHWENRGYGDFDDFLGALASRKRKAIRKERQAVAAAGVTMRALTGGEIRPEHWDDFFAFYTSTSDRKWGHPYLTRRFFDLLGERLGDRVVLVFAEHEGRRVAGALNLIGGDTLYGRNWGCAGHFRFLHFEACYYQAIAFAIDRGLQRVEAGAQGEHKIQRGYLPTPTYSAHLIRDPALRRAVADFLEREREMVEWEIEALHDASPFRKGDGGAASG